MSHSCNSKDASKQNTPEKPSRRAFVKRGVALLGAPLFGMHIIEAQASSGMPEVFEQHPDPAIRDAWRHRNNSYGIERIYGFTRRKSHDFTAFPHVMRESSKATPEYHWILLRSIPRYFYFDNFHRNGSPKTEKNLSINYETQKPLWYLVQGMWQYWEEKNYTKAEEHFLTSLFLASNFSPQDASQVGLDSPSANQEGLALSYTSQYLEKPIPERKQILNQIYNKKIISSDSSIFLWTLYLTRASDYKINSQKSRIYRDFIKEELIIPLENKFNSRIRSPPSIFK